MLRRLQIGFLRVGIRQTAMLPQRLPHSVVHHIRQRLSPVGIFATSFQARRSAKPPFRLVTEQGGPDTKRMYFGQMGTVDQFLRDNHR
jgi:hypothetical protein